MDFGLFGVVEGVPCVGLFRFGNKEMVGAVAGFGFATIDHRVIEAADMAGGVPNFGVLDDGGVEADDGDGVAVGADGGCDDHVFPPAIAEVVFELCAQRTEIPKAVIAAIDVGGLENEAAAFAEGDDVFHVFGHVFGHLGISLFL